MYDKNPIIKVNSGNAAVWKGYDNILAKIQEEIRTGQRRVLVIDCYPGTDYRELEAEIIKPLNPALVICSDDLTMPESEINRMIESNLTSDRVFGIMSYAKLQDYFDESLVSKARKRVREARGLTVVYGVGAALVSERGLIVYADLCRWEIQKRYRSGMIPNWKANNYKEDPLRMFKRGYFWEWRIADRHKLSLLNSADYYMETNTPGMPCMVGAFSYIKALEDVARRPFRTQPYFDPGVWGGRWMIEHCGLDPKQPNYAWCFDGVPEENSLLLDFGGKVLQTPCINLVLLHPVKLLGEKVYARFGAEFPIRFDFLDTMGGQNLSLQVHPTTNYIQKEFGMHYTQDESYYILEAGRDACVYLGVKENVDKESMIGDLYAAQESGQFDDGKYINKFPAHKHDHFSIPSGTIHCSGANTMVLEISSTPYIFTFKLWDWGRLGLDGRPRPCHIGHGSKNINMKRDTRWIEKNLVNRSEVLISEEGWVGERTGLHELEFIETRREWFCRQIELQTNDSVNVLNLVEGDAAVVMSPGEEFEPYVVHYAVQFIIPASVRTYTIAPFGDHNNKKMAVIRAYVRT